MDVTTLLQSNMVSCIKNLSTGTSLVIQWLTLCILSAGDLASISGQGARYHMLQLTAPMPTTTFTTKNSCVTTKRFYMLQIKGLVYCS